MGPFAVRLGSTTEVLPDLLFISHERRLILTDTRVEGAPDLLIEVISPKSKKIDQIFKRDLYAKYGVRYYWIVEPLAEWIRAYELGADGLYELVAEAHGREAFSAPPFSDLQISLSDLWDM